MGLGPGGTSLLHKLGKKQAWEMSEDELQNIVRVDQFRRTTSRSIARFEKMMNEDEAEVVYRPRSSKALAKTAKGSSPKRSKKTKAAMDKLEHFGLNPGIIEKLRATGKPDFQIILELKTAGVIT